MTKTKQMLSLSLQYILKRHPELADTTILHPAAGDTRTASGVFLQSHRKSTANVDNKKKMARPAESRFFTFNFLCSNFFRLFVHNYGTCAKRLL